MQLETPYHLLPHERWYAERLLERQRTHRTPGIVRTELDLGRDGIILMAGRIHLWHSRYGNGIHWGGAPVGFQWYPAASRDRELPDMDWDYDNPAGNLQDTAGNPCWPGFWR